MATCQVCNMDDDDGHTHDQAPESGDQSSGADNQSSSSNQEPQETI